MVTPVHTQSNALSALGGNSAVSANKGFGQDVFLKLLVTQLANQDPTKPMDSSQFASQLAQFSALQQMTSINNVIMQLANMQKTSDAIAMIGKTVAAKDAAGETIMGVVKQVTFANGKPQLLVNDRIVDVSSVLTVM